MDIFEIQGKTFRIVAVLLLISVLALIAVIPVLIKEITPDGIPPAASIATAVAMGIRLLIFLGVLYGIRVTKRKRRINNEINIVTAVVLFLLGFVLIDGAVAYVDSLIFVSICMFLSVLCDFGVTAVSVWGFILVRRKKKQ